MKQTSELLFDLFVNRQDVYAEAFLQKDGKKMGYAKKLSPITPNLIDRHILGNKTLGVYQLNGNNVKWACLDFDENTEKDFENAKTLYFELKKLSLNPLFEMSGGGNYKCHIWLFVDCQAKDVYYFLRDLTERLNLKPHEIFPKQLEVSDSLPYGNLVKLPLAYHLVTKQRSRFLNEEFNEIPLSDLAKLLEFYLNNKSLIPKYQEKPLPILPLIQESNEIDNFMNYVLNNELPKGISVTNKIYPKIEGVNSNILKNLAIWFYQKGYTLDRLKTEVKQTFLLNGRSVSSYKNLEGWFKKAQKGDITQINVGELAEWIKTYMPDLIKLLPQKISETSTIGYNNKPIELWNYSDFEKLKIDNNFLVQNLLYPQTINLIYSPPAEFKSLLVLLMLICIANGKPFLNFKTKKQPVLYCDKENNDQIIKKRFMALHKGLNLRRKGYPLYFIRRNGDLLHNGFVNQLKKVIIEKKIKLVVFDTLHRFADYDENKSDDINRLYSLVFQPLQELGCSVICIHHTTKPDQRGNVVYRGSGDFMGMVDTAYLVRREKTADSKTNRFRLINEKSRAGEIEQVFGEIDFSDDGSYIKINRLDENIETEKKVGELKRITEKIKEFMPSGKPMKRKDFEDSFTMANIEYTTSTLKRSLKWLVDNGYFEFDKSKNTYWRQL